MFKKFFSRKKKKPAVAGGASSASAEKTLFSHLTDRLFKSSSHVSDGITRIFAAHKIEDSVLNEFEEMLIAADLGVSLAHRVRASLSKKKVNKDTAAADATKILMEEITAILAPVAKDLNVDQGHKPHIILMVGVNGGGKTTTIGKMAHQLKLLGKTVMVAAGDTFRAAAVDQLEVWARRAGVPIVRDAVGKDAASVAFAAIDAAREQNIDVLIIDTAGRLQSRNELMEELHKIVRVIRKKEPSAPHDTILVLDATTGQNALVQTEAFLKAAEITGLVMTKLDGTAKGGILVACAEKFHLPIYAVGVGEGIEDLQPFDAHAFTAALIGSTASL